MDSLVIKFLTPPSDGRRERSRSSRAKIVEAMLELVAGGDVAPSAARVAESAGVGLRTVFRHFDDMDSLYREMSHAIEAQVMPIISQPFVANDWRARLFEIADRRCLAFDTIMPYRISANIKRFQSPFLMQEYRRLISLEQDMIRDVLPPDVRKNALMLQSITVPLSFQCWRLLRHDQQLDFEPARQTVRMLLAALLSHHDILIAKGPPA